MEKSVMCVRADVWLVSIGVCEKRTRYVRSVTDEMDDPVVFCNKNCSKQRTV